MKAQPVEYDLPGLWNKLGVEDHGGLSFNDRAPLADIRRAITTAPAGTKPCQAFIGKSADEDELPIVSR
jgi:hypothetical protein